MGTRLVRTMPLGGRHLHPGSVAAVSGVRDRRRPRPPRPRHARATGSRPASPTRRPRRSRRSPPARSASAGSSKPPSSPSSRGSRACRASTTARSSTTTGTARPAAAGSSRSARWASASATTTGELRVFPRDARIDAPERWRRPVGHARRAAARAGAADRGRRSAPPSPTRPRRSTTSCAVHVRRTGAADGWWDAASGASPIATGRRASSPATWSRSSARPSPSATWATRPVPTWAWARAGSRTTRRSRRTSPRRARQAPWPTIRPTAWGNAAIPGLRHRPARAAGRPSTRARTRCPSADAADAARVERTFEIAPDTLVVAAVPDGPAPDRLRQPGRGHGAPGGPVPRRPARGRARDRVGDGLRGHARWRVRLVNAASYAAVFAVGCRRDRRRATSCSQATTRSWRSGSASTRPGRTSTSSCSSATTSCRTSSPPSAA